MAKELQEFNITRDYKQYLELILFALCILSLICASLLAHIVRIARKAAKNQSKFMIDNAMDSLLSNSPEYALTEFVLLMAICDIIKSIIGAFQFLRYAFSFWTTCIPTSFPGVLCLIEEFIKWTLISNDIICYGVICFCLFRYLRKRSIFTQHSITPIRIIMGVCIISLTQSSIQTLLVILYEDYGFNHEIIYIPTLIILYCTIFYVASVFIYIRCCHHFWILGARQTKNQYIFIIVFSVIFVLPITLKVKYISSHIIKFNTYINIYIYIDGIDIITK